MTPTLADMSRSSPDESLDRLVWDRVAEMAREGLTVLDGGCWLHERERISAFGALWPVRKTIWQSHQGNAVPPGSNLVRRCDSIGCCNPEHIEAVARAELGRWLGRLGGAWRPPQVA